MADKRLTVNIRAVAPEPRQTIHALTVRQATPDYIIIALLSYLDRHDCEDTLNQANCGKCTWCQTRYWVHGDEV